MPAREGRRTGGTRKVDPEVARFFMALGAVGYIRPAAELAGVDLERAWEWVAGIERPSWTTRRAEAAIRLFTVATEALDRTRRLLTGSEVDDDGGPGLRDLVMVAERFYTAALKLDKDVAADGARDWELELATGTAGQASPSSAAEPADTAPGAADGHE